MKYNFLTIFALFTAIILLNELIFAGCNDRSQSMQHKDMTSKRILYIVRHAKSSWKDPSQTDFERPLKKRGERDAPVIGKILASKGVHPDLMLSSPAVRAISTALILAEEIKYPSDKIIANEAIYEASISVLLDIIKQLDDSLQNVMIVGHNPCFTGLANYLTDEYFDNIPTCGVVAVEFKISTWKKIEKDRGMVLFYEYPKKHK